MFTNLPEMIKQQVLRLLEQDDYVSAKQIYDHWLKKAEAAR